LPEVLRATVSVEETPTVQSFDVVNAPFHRVALAVPA
jgi:hypothetical protein